MCIVFRCCCFVGCCCCGCCYCHCLLSLYFYFIFARASKILVMCVQSCQKSSTYRTNSYVSGRDIHVKLIRFNHVQSTSSMRAFLYECGLARSSKGGRVCAEKSAYVFGFRFGTSCQWRYKIMGRKVANGICAVLIITAEQKIFLHSSFWYDFHRFYERFSFDYFQCFGEENHFGILNNDKLA